MEFKKLIDRGAELERMNEALHREDTQYNTPCEVSPLLCFLTTCLKLRSSNTSKPKRQLCLYLCICIPTLAQSWAFSKDYGCKDSDYLGKLYQKRRENYDNFLNYLPKKMNLSASF